eukprot:TRINITY_DN4540_c1_g1_i1.p1 TRINITY_DN4540_c1_g1~~TRINITY_DN4540_c1_g1_i1.p1  ORF type:complete len:104 (-),score=11.63 TRINITY_DN4540_c1_g1_i1:69-380(-)
MTSLPFVGTLLPTLLPPTIDPLWFKEPSRDTDEYLTAIEEHVAEKVCQSFSSSPTHTLSLSLSPVRSHSTPTPPPPPRPHTPHHSISTYVSAKGIHSHVVFKN